MGTGSPGNNFGASPVPRKMKTSLRRNLAGHGRLLATVAAGVALFVLGWLAGSSPTYGPPSRSVDGEPPWLINQNPNQRVTPEPLSELKVRTKKFGSIAISF